MIADCTCSLKKLRSKEELKFQFLLQWKSTLTFPSCERVGKSLYPLTFFMAFLRPSRVYPQDKFVECRQREDWPVLRTSCTASGSLILPLDLLCGLGKVTEPFCYTSQSLKWELCVSSLMCIDQRGLESYVGAIQDVVINIWHKQFYFLLEANWLWRGEADQKLTRLQEWGAQLGVVGRAWWSPHMGI